MKNWTRIIIGLIFISMNISCDQITKTVVRSEIPQHGRITVIDDHLTLTNIENTGAFLSVGQNWWTPIKIIVLNVLPLIVLSFGLYFMIKSANHNLWLTLSIGFIIGGGIGNMIDRLIYGSVTDFLHFKLGPFQTGIFNMADVSIMIGVGMLLLFFTGKPKQLSNSV